MNILLINASPHEQGSTAHALSYMEEVLMESGANCERFHLGKGAYLSCIACGFCKTNGRCFQSDAVNQLIDRLPFADGLVFASPVHYAGVTGSLKCVMGRLFHAASGMLAGKPAVAVTVGRRGGHVAALAEIEKFFTYCAMPIVSGSYWCMLTGRSPEEIDRDTEGISTVRAAAKNLFWLAKCIECGHENGICRI